jgi:hypothetical protein
MTHKKCFTRARVSVECDPSSELLGHAHQHGLYIVDGPVVTHNGPGVPNLPLFAHKKTLNSKIISYLYTRIYFSALQNQFHMDHHDLYQIYCSNLIFLHKSPFE